MTDHKKLGAIKLKIVPILKSYGVEEAYIFGSTARGDSGPGSDVDLMIDKIDSPRTFFRLAALTEELEQALGQKVDLMFDKTIKPSVRPYIIKDRIRLI